MSDLPPTTPTDLPPGDGADLPGGPPPRRRGLTALIIVLAVIVLALIIALVWLLVANAKPATPTPTPTPTPTATQTPTSRPTPTATTTPTAVVSRCTVNQLSVTLGTGNGAAGSEIVPIVFTNTGSTSCELHGFPGVSFVGDGNGTQLGAAADEDSSTPIVANTLKPGGAVQAMLKIATAQNFSNCTVVAADGLRVYPPHSFDSVFVKTTGMSACSNADVHLLTVKPVAAG